MTAPRTENMGIIREVNPAFYPIQIFNQIPWFRMERNYLKIHL